MDPDKIESTHTSLLICIFCFHFDLTAGIKFTRAECHFSLKKKKKTSRFHVTIPFNNSYFKVGQTCGPKTLDSVPLIYSISQQRV